MFRRRSFALFTLLSALGGSLYSAVSHSPAAQALADGATCGQTASPTIIYDQPRQDANIVAQVIPSGRRLTLDPRFSSRGWVQITSEAVYGFTREASLEDCDSSSLPPDNTPETPDQPSEQAVVGSCAIALEDRSAPVLSVRGRAGAEDTFNGVAAGDSIVLGRRVLYNTEQRRYWRQMLAYPPLRENRSPSGEAWIAETGPDTPRLQQNSGGILITTQGRVYTELNITRRPCRELFSNGIIQEGRTLPQRLPDGYSRP
ncbi:MAG: hypothetical protein WBA10_18515 [Elainellaceae cyanobacterium]